MPRGGYTSTSKFKRHILSRVRGAYFALRYIAHEANMRPVLYKVGGGRYLFHPVITSVRLIVLTLWKRVLTFPASRIASVWLSAWVWGLMVCPAPGSAAGCQAPPPCGAFILLEGIL